MILTEGPNNGPVFMISEFDENMEASIPLALTAEIQKQRKKREQDRCIDLYINSFGGYRHVGMQIVSLVNIAKRDGITIRTIVPDVAYSMGSILAVCGTVGERYIESGGEHLVHYGWTASEETTEEQVRRNAVQKVNAWKKMRKVYTDNTNLSAIDLDELARDDSNFISAAKAKQWGFADKYMDKFDIGRTAPND